MPREGQAANRGDRLDVVRPRRQRLLEQVVRPAVVARIASLADAQQVGAGQQRHRRWRRGGWRRGQPLLGTLDRSLAQWPPIHTLRRSNIAWAPSTVQCMPARLSRVPITTLQPASITPVEVHKPCW